jgi:hypothetical protein
VGEYSFPKSTKGLKPEKIIFQEVLQTEPSTYKTMIREAFAQKKSVFIILPTEYDIKSFNDALTRGSEQFTFVFHSRISRERH